MGQVPSFVFVLSLTKYNSFSIQTPDGKKAEILEISDDDEEAVEISDDEEALEVSDDEEAGLSNFTSLFHGLVNHIEPPADQPKAGPGLGQGESPALLEEGLVRVRTLEDVELLSQDISASDTALLTTQILGTAETDTQSATQQADKKRKKMIDPNEVLTKEAKVIEMPLAPTAVEDVEVRDTVQRPIHVFFKAHLKRAPFGLQKASMHQSAHLPAKRSLRILCCYLGN